MKKLYLLMVMVMFAGIIFAQTDISNASKQTLNSKHPVNLSGKHIDVSNLNLHKSPKSTASRWYNYATAMQNYVFPNGNSGNYSVDRMFPDTTVNVKYSNGTFPPDIHAIAVVLDPTAKVFQNDTLPFNIATRFYKYRLDSVGILCLYARHNPDQNIVDTLEVEMITNAAKTVYQFTGMKAAYGYDTTVFLGLKHNTNFDYVKPDNTTNVVKIKLPLTYQSSIDTLSNGFNYFYVKSTQTVSYGALCAATFRFIPGYTWTDQDTLNRNLNEFLFLSYEENGTNTYPSYKPGNYNLSEVIPTFALQTSNSWYKSALYVPSLAFVQGYTLENHWVDFKLTSTNVGITENAEKSVKLAQNVPNPANNSTLINYELKQANNVTLVITDLTGNKVMEVAQGKQIAGSHNIILNLDNLSSGMYYYTLKADNTSLTKKMIVTK